MCLVLFTDSHMKVLNIRVSAEHTEYWNVDEYENIIQMLRCRPHISIWRISPSSVCCTWQPSTRYTMTSWWANLTYGTWEYRWAIGIITLVWYSSPLPSLANHSLPLMWWSYEILQGKTVIKFQHSFFCKCVVWY
jgi:hypothetical protein